MVFDFTNDFYFCASHTIFFFIFILEEFVWCAFAQLKQKFSVFDFCFVVSYKSIEMFTIVNKLDATIYIQMRTYEFMGKMLIGCGCFSFVCIFQHVGFLFMHIGIHFFFHYLLRQMMKNDNVTLTILFTTEK